MSLLSDEQCVEYHPKMSEELSSDSNVFRDFTNTVYHLLTTLRAHLCGAPSHLLKTLRSYKLNVLLPEAIIEIPLKVIA